MIVVKRGLFFRIIVDKKMMSKKKFWRRYGAFKYYYTHQDKYGLPITERKGKWLK